MSQEISERILDICTVYEEGYAAGELGITNINTYDKDTDEEKFYAWHYGHSNALTTKLLGTEHIEFIPDF